MQMAVVVGNRTSVAGRKRVEVNIRAKIVKIGVERSFFVVIANLAINDLCMPDRKIEDARARVALTRPSSRQVAVAGAIDAHVHNRSLNDELVQVNFSMKGRLNFESDGQFIDLQKRGLFGGFRAMHGNVIKMCGQCGDAKIQSADGGFSSCSLFGRLHNSAQGILLEGVALQE